MSAPGRPPSLVRPLEGARRHTRDWTVRVDDQVLADVGTVTLSNPRIGTLTYGETAMGHDGWTFRELGGGGVVVAPWLRRDGRVLVGAVLQDRPTQGGPVWNLPRGFIDPGESHAVAARREFEEETGAVSSERLLSLLDGAPCNPNSAFFETPTREFGVRFYGLALREDDVEERQGALVIARAFRSEGASAAAARTLERISQTRLFDWTEIARLGDMFSVAAVARLLAHLEAPTR